MSRSTSSTSTARGADGVRRQLPPRPPAGEQGANCQLYHRDWDHHGNLKPQIAGIAQEVDQPCAPDQRPQTARCCRTADCRTAVHFPPIARAGRDHHMKASPPGSLGRHQGITYGDRRAGTAPSNIVEVHDSTPRCSTCSSTTGSCLPLPRPRLCLTSAATLCGRFWPESMRQVLRCVAVLTLAIPAKQATIPSVGII
jgi:hypothetical protein